MCVCLCSYGQRLDRTQLDQREQLQQLRAEQQQLQRYLDQLTTAQRQMTTSGPFDTSAHQYRVHSSLSESSSGSLSSTGYSSSEHGLSTSGITGVGLWSPCVIGQTIYIFILSLVLCFFSFLAYSQRSEIGCLPYFHTWCGLSANLGCRSETCCTRLAGNAGRKKIAKKSPSVHNRTTFSGSISSQLRHISTIGKKKTCQAAMCPPHVLTIW